MKTHVVLIPFPAQGHFLPVIYLSKKLAELGCQVTIVNLECIHEQLQVWSFSSDLDITLEALHPDLDMAKGVLASFQEDELRFVQALAALEGEFRSIMKRLMEQRPVSCVISDFYVGSWPVSVAAEFQVPHAAYWPGSATWLSLEYHLHLVLSNGDISSSDRDDHLISYVPGIELKQSQLPYHYSPKLAEQLSIDIQRINKSSWILCNTFDDLEPKVVKTLKGIFNDRLLTVGPLFPVENDEISVLSFLREDRWCLSWLDKQEPRSVVYMSFGSIARLPRMQFEELAEGLEASKVKFLLTVRPQLVSELCDDFFNGFVERTKERGLTVSWSPQREVLKHAAVAGFVTHCGWNSVMESVCNGVPTLCWPCIYEQVLNSKVVEDNKLGVELRRNSQGLVERDEVQRMLRVLLEGEEMKFEAGKAGKAARRSAKSGNSRSNLLNFIQQLD